MVYSILGYLKRNWLLVSILIVGAFLRLYRIDKYLTFLGDEGRDVMIVRNLLVHFDPILIGPGTSVGNMYLGPLYYYFMAPFLLLFNFSPIGPAVGVALLGVATIYLVYLAGFEWFSKKAGLISALLYAISPTVINYSRSSWNPNIMPFFALLSIYSVWRVYKLKQYNWLLVTAVSFAFVLQSHYLGLLLAPVLIIYWFLSKVPLKKTLISLGIFIFLMSPVVIIDFRHDYLNSKSLYTFLVTNNEDVTLKPLTIVKKIYPIFNQINTSLLVAKNEQMGTVITGVFVFVFLTLLLHVRKPNIQYTTYNILLIWLGFGILGLSIYDRLIIDHYFGFLFPVPFLLYGLLFQKTFESRNMFLKIFSICLFSILIFINLNNCPLNKEPNRQMERAKTVADKIIIESNNIPYNIAVIAETNYEDGYQYFLEKENSKVIEIDSQIEDSVTDQLFVICEVNGSTLTKDTCKPVNSPKAQVANFGWSKIENTWEVGGVILYKLVHTK